MLRITIQVQANFSVAAAGTPTKKQAETSSATAVAGEDDCGTAPDPSATVAEESPDPSETVAVETPCTCASVASPTPSSAATTVGVCKSAGSLGGPPPVVTQDNSARPFSVDGSTFLNKAAACGRACDVQHKYNLLVLN